MSKKGTYIPLLIFLLLVPVVAAVAQVSLSDINQKGVNGRLGHRLGTIVTIQGKVIPNETRAKEMSEYESLLEIQHVNDKALSQPVIYPATPSQLSEIKLPKLGETFKFVAYETGAFTGSPAGEFQYVPVYQSTAFFFTTTLVLLK